MNELPVDDARAERASRDWRDQPEEHQNFELIVERKPGRKINLFLTQLSSKPVIVVSSKYTWPGVEPEGRGPLHSQKIGTG